MTALTKLKKTQSPPPIKHAAGNDNVYKTTLTDAEKAEIAAFYQKIKPMLKDLPLD